MDNVRLGSSSSKGQHTLPGQHSLHNNIRSQSFTDQLRRWAPGIGAGVLTFLALSRRSKKGVALALGGGLLAHRIANASSSPRRFRAEASFSLNCSPAEAFQVWRNFENLPLFMRHLQSVTVSGDRRSQWTAIGPLGREVQWTAEIVDERANEWIIWRSLPGSDFFHSGSVEFRTDPTQRGTIVTAVMDYRPPAGVLGKTVASMLGKDPQFTIREDLRRFKALVESGEVPTIEGQSHGPRSAFIKGMHAAYPNKRKPTEPAAREIFSAQQRRA